MILKDYLLVSAITLISLFPFSVHGDDRPFDEKVTPESLLSLSKGYDPDLLKELAGDDSRDRDGDSQLERQILMAAAKGDTQFAHLLKDKGLRESRKVGLALAAYDYALNESKDSLNIILAQIATDPLGGDVDSIVVLGVVDEWERSIPAFKKHFRQTDGAGFSCMTYFLQMRSRLYPKKYIGVRKHFEGSKYLEYYENYLPNLAKQDSADQPAAALVSKLDPLLLNMSKDHLKALDEPDLKKVKIDPKALATIQSEMKVIFGNLDKDLDKAERKKIADNGIVIMGMFHHGLGRHVRNKYGLWSGKTRLGKAFRKIGISHADYSSPIVLKEYWRHVNGSPSRLRAELALQKMILAILKRDSESSIGKDGSPEGTPSSTPK